MKKKATAAGAQHHNNNPTTSSSLSHQQQRSSSSSTSSYMSTKRTLNQFIYVTFIVVVFGAGVRIYVYEQEHSIMGVGKTIGNDQSDIITSSLHDFVSNANKGRNEHQKTRVRDDASPHYHTLQCDAYGGPSEQDAQEMVYWQGTKDGRKSPREWRRTAPFNDATHNFHANSFLQHFKQKTFLVIHITWVRFMWQKLRPVYRNIWHLNRMVVDGIIYGWPWKRWWGWPLRRVGR